MPQGWNLEWLNANAERAFPFKEDASRQDINALVRLPNSLIVDMVFVVPAGSDYRYWLKSLMYSGTHLNLVLADEADNTVGSLTIDLSTHNRNDAYTIVGEEAFAGSVGRIALGDLANLSESVPPGAYTFSLAATEFELRTVRPDLRAVYSLAIIAADGSESEQATGAVKLLAGQNIRLTYIPAAGGDPAGVRIDATENSDYEEDCGCDSAVKPLEPIRSINGVGANPVSGRLDLVSMSPCLDIRVEGDTVVLEDKCSEPCLGCPEVEFLTDRLKLLEDTLFKLEDMQHELADNERDFYRDVLETLK